MCNDCAKISSPDQIITGCCILQNGFYCIWTLNHMAMVCEEWAELCDFYAIIRQVSHINFSVVSERQRARTALNNLKRDAPFDECVRFPYRKTYVNLSCGIYASTLMNILAALDFKTRDAEKKSKYSTKEAALDDQQESRTEYSFDDASMQFRNNLKSLLNELCKNVEVYDRIKFERKYDLTWCLGDCPKEPPYVPPSDPTNPEPPNNPRRYGALLDKLKAKGLNPADYSIFTGADLLAGNFKCDRVLQTLGEGMRNARIPDGVTQIYVFTSGEYVKCDTAENTRGFVYRVESNTLVGEITLRPTHVDPDEEYKNFVESVDLEAVLRKMYDRSRGHKWPNSRIPSRVESLCDDDFAEASNAIRPSPGET